MVNVKQNETFRNPPWTAEVFVSPGSRTWKIELRQHGNYVGTFPLRGGYASKAAAVNAAMKLMGEKKK